MSYRHGSLSLKMLENKGLFAYINEIRYLLDTLGKVSKLNNAIKKLRKALFYGLLIIYHSIVCTSYQTHMDIVLGILRAFLSTWLVNSALGIFREQFVALGKPSRTYLKTYLKNLILIFYNF